MKRESTFFQAKMSEITSEEECKGEWVVARMAENIAYLCQQRLKLQV